MDETREHPASQGNDADARKPYIKPEIIYDLELETRAGSPLRIPDVPDPLDPLDTMRNP